MFNRHQDFDGIIQSNFKFRLDSDCCEQQSSITPNHNQLISTSLTWFSFRN